MVNLFQLFLLLLMFNTLYLIFIYTLLNKFKNTNAPLTLFGLTPAYFCFVAMLLQVFFEIGDLVIRQILANLFLVTLGIKFALFNKTLKRLILKTIFSDNRQVIGDSNLEKVFNYFPRLNERKDQLAATLSGGELQMLCIGRGLMSSPKMIMLDEPSAALAPQIVLDIFKNINKIRKDGLTVLVVEQNVRMALLLSDYGYVIKDGIINVEGESKKLMYDDAVKDSYLGGTKANV